MLYDFVYYGVTFNQPQIIKQVFGADDSLQALCLQNIAVAAFGLPAVILAIVNLRCMGAKRLQSWGFVAILLCALVSGLHSLSSSESLDAGGLVASGAQELPHAAADGIHPLRSLQIGARPPPPPSASPPSHHSNMSGFVLLILLITALNWGVNVTTYVMPTEAFPSEVCAAFSQTNASSTSHPSHFR